MRTVIINTLGTPYTQKDVFYMAFAPEQILWMDYELEHIHDCVEVFRQIHHRQTVSADFQLIVLMSPDGFEGAEYADHREERLQKLLQAWLVAELLMPLDEIDVLPSSVTVLLVCRKNTDNVTSPIRTFTAMLHLKDGQIPKRIEIPYLAADGSEHVLDLTSMLELEETLSDMDEEVSEITAETPEEYTPEESGRTGNRMIELDDLDIDLRDNKKQRQIKKTEGTIEKTIDVLQQFRLKRNADKKMEIMVVPFLAEHLGQTAANADLQINLVRLIRSAEKTGVPDTTVVQVHSPMELWQLLADAEATIGELTSPDLSRPVYCKLEKNLYSQTDVSELELDIRKALKEKTEEIPGVSEALADWEQSDFNTQNGNELKEADNTLLSAVQKEIRSGVLIFSKERKLFRERYSQLMREYDREKVQEDQRKLFDICAGGYTAWRDRERSRRPHRDFEPTEPRRPLMEANAEKELLAARARCAEGILSQLEDYSDVRKEAADLHTEFKTLTRVWSPDLHKLSTKYFYRFSAIMGLIFIVLMILPFFMISGQVGDLRIARLIAWLINSGVFLLLYVIGFLIWLHKAAKDTRELRGRLELLILKSQMKRRESVFRTISTYTRELPACLIKSLNYGAMIEADSRNTIVAQKIEQHMRLLKNAAREISDMRTAIRTPEHTVQGKPLEHRLIEYMLPPYAPENQCIYMFFVERREND